MKGSTFVILYSLEWGNISDLSQQMILTESKDTYTVTTTYMYIIHVCTTQFHSSFTPLPLPAFLQNIDQKKLHLYTLLLFFPATDSLNLLYVKSIPPKVSSTQSLYSRHTTKLTKNQLQTISFLAILPSMIFFFLLLN